MITFEEIRDIIEEEVYIGSGTVLGVSDAARAVLARIEAAQHRVQADDCPSCAGSGKKEIYGMLLTCLACDGTGNRR